MKIADRLRSFLPPMPKRRSDRRPPALVEVLEARIAPATFTWIAPGSGSWTTPANWSVTNGTSVDGIPHAGDDVTINPAAVGAQITISAGAQAANSLSIPGDDFLQMTGGSLTLGMASSINGLLLGNATLTADAQLTLTGAGNAFSNGATLTGLFRNEGTVTLGGNAHLKDAILNNAGTITQTTAAGAVFFEGTSPALHNLPGALYDVQIAGNSSFVQSTAASEIFDNAGTLRRDGTAEAQFGGVNFHNAAGGVIEVLSGTLKLNAVGSMEGGVFNVSSGATLDLGSIAQTWTGTFTGSGAGVVDFRSGTITPGTGGAMLNFPAGLFQWDSGGKFANGTLTNLGSIAIVGSGMSLQDASLNNAGTITQTAAAGHLDFAGTSPALYNLAGALYDVQIAGDTAFLLSTAASEIFDNAGTLRRDGTAQAQFGGVHFHNAAGGVIEVLNGTLRINAPGSMDGGVFNVSSGATLNLGSIAQTWTGIFTGSGAGTVDFGSGTITPGTGGATLNFPAGLFDWDTGGTFANGTVTNLGSISIVGGSVHLKAAILNNAGTITQPAGAGALIFEGASPALYNLASALYDVQITGDAAFLQSTAASEIFDNAGTLRRDGTGQAQFGGVHFHNAASGVIEVLNGTLRINAPGSMDGGVFNVSSGATLNLGSIAQTWTGNFTGSGAGTVDFNSGTITLGTGGATLNFPAGLFDWDTGGTFANGTVTNLGSISIVGGSVHLKAAILNNAGTITQPAGAGALIFDGASPALYNLAGALYDVQITGDSAFLQSTTGSEIFDNAGTLRRDGTGQAQFGGVTFHNAAGGVIEVLNGALRMNAAGSMDGGVFNVSSGATLDLGSIAQTWAGTFTGSGAGAVDFHSGTITPGKYGMTLNFPAGLFDWDTGGTFANGTVTNPGSISIVGGNVHLNTATLDNAGTITQTASAGALIFDGTTSALHNLAGALYDVQIAGNASFLQSNATSEIFDNAGTLRRDGTFIASLGGVHFSNTGVVEVVSGEFQVNGPVVQVLDSPNGGALTGGSWKVDAGGTLVFAENILTNNAFVEIAGTAPQLDAIAANTGTLNLRGGHSLATSGGFINNGTLSLGPGSVFTVNGPFSSGVNSSLEFQIGGTPASGSIGQLVSTGVAALAGTARFSLVNNYALQTGQQYTVAAFPSHTGAFTSFAGLYLQKAKIFDPVLNAATLVVNAAANAADLSAAVTGTSASGISGQDVTVDFKVTNNASTTTFTSAWTDSVFLSLDGILDPSDKLVGRVPHTGALAGGASYDVSLVAPLPGVLPGQYHFLVVADSAGQMPDTNRDNNTEASGLVTTDISALNPGQQISGSIANGQDVFYRVNLAAGETPVFTAHYGSNGTAELYVGQLFVPGPNVYDALQYSAASQDAQITGFSPLAGTYYVLLHGRESAGGGTPFTLTASSLGFAVTSIDTPSGANAGTLTTAVHGSLFRPDTTFSLVPAVGSPIPAQHVYYQDGATAYVTFDLTGLPVGDYGVRATEGATSDTLSHSVHVTAGTPGTFSYTLSAPRYIRPNFVGVFATLTYQNTGETDLISPILTLTGANGVFHLVGEEGGQTGSIELLAINPTGPAGILPPGAHGQLQVEFVPAVATPHSLVQFTSHVSGPDELPLNWSLAKDALRPASVAADAWEAIYANFTAQIGTTFAQYKSVIAENASYLSLLGHRTADVGELLNYELLQAGDFGAITHQYELGVLGRGLSESFEIHAVTAPPKPLPAGFTPRVPPTVIRDANGAVAFIGRFTAFGSSAGGNGGGVYIEPPPDPVPSLDDLAGVEGNVTIQLGDQIRSFISIGDGASFHKGEFIGTPGETGTLVRLDSGALKLTELNGSVTMFRASDGRLDYTETAAGYRVTAGYNSAGQVVTLTETNGDVTTLTYNTAGRVTQIADPVGHVNTFTYDVANEHLLTRTDAGGTETFTYVTGQGAAREHALASVAYPDGSKVSFQYDGQGRLISREGNGGAQKLSYTYDSAGTITETDLQGNATSIYRDHNGQAVRLIDASGHVSTATFDDRGQLTSAADTGGAATFVDYNTGGVVNGTVNAAGERLGFETGGAMHLLTKLTDTLGRVTQFGHDASGNLTSITDALGGVVSYGFDTVGRLTQTIDESGRIIGYTYDAKGLLVFKDFPGTADDVTYTYDAHRNLHTATSAAEGTTTYDYDATDRVTKVTYPSGKFIAYTYNADGQRTAMSDQSGFTLHYTYDALGRLDKVTDPNNATLDAYAYDNVGRLASEKHGNNATTTYGYDALGRITSITHTAPDQATVLESFTYTYDAGGHVTQQTSSVSGTTDYGYDIKGQLTSVLLPGGRTITYRYDSEGNRTVVSDSAAGSTSYVTNALNQYVSAGSVSYSYDPEGHLVARTGGASGTASYTYDLEGRLIAAVTPDGSFTYEYDAAGNRIGMTKDGVRTDYLVDATGLGNVFAEYGAGGTLTAHYAEGIGLAGRIDAGGQAAYYHYDLTGNTQLLTGANGVVLDTYEYLPFGEKTGSTGTLQNSFTFGGRFGVQEAGAGLYDLHARAYDPALGRFLQKDPIGLNAGDTNLYRYAGNNPAGLLDPSGLGASSAGVSLSSAGYSLSSVGTSLSSAGIGVSSVGTSFSSAGMSLSSVGYSPSSAGTSPSSVGISVSSAGASLSSAGFGRVGNLSAPNLGTSDYSRIYDRIDYANYDYYHRYLPEYYKDYLDLYADYARNTDGYNNKPAKQASDAPSDESVEYVQRSVKYYRPPLTAKPGPNNSRVDPPARKATQDPVPYVLEPFVVYPFQLLEPFIFTLPTFHTVSEVITPGDPNNIVGPNGVGADPLLDVGSQPVRFDGFVKPDGHFDYTIQFENKPTASAPAQVVQIVQTLDAGLDLNTFELGSFGFGNLRVDVPAGLDHYSKRIDATATVGVLVDVDAALDRSTREVHWTFTSLDPGTGDLTTDPLAGFLPANLTVPQGDGYVTYSVAPNAGLVSGARIDALATITFDTEAPINTPAIHNIIDSQAPTSAVTPFAGATTVRGNFKVAFTGADEAGGSGLHNVSLFYRDNGGPLQTFVPESTGTAARFTGGLIGHTYTFFSSAVDNVGNSETVSATPDATISVVAPVHAATIVARHSFNYTDANGDLVTVRLTGPGSAVADLTGDANPTTTHADLDTLILANTTAKSAITVTVRKAHLAGDGLTTIGEVTGTKLGSFSAPQADFVVEGLVFTGAVGSVAIHDLLQSDPILASPTISTGGLTKDTLSVTAHHLADNFALTTTSTLKSLRAADVGEGSIHAAVLGSLSTTAGAMNADLVITGAAGAITVKTGVDAGAWSAASFGTVHTGLGNFAADLTTAGKLGLLKITKGNLTGNLTGGSLGTISVAAGGASGTWSAGSVGAVSVVGGALSATVTDTGALTSVHVGGGDLSGNLTAQRLGAVSVTGGNFTSTITSTGLPVTLGRLPALTSLTVTTGQLTGNLSLLGAAGPIVEKGTVATGTWSAGSFGAITVTGAPLAATISTAGAVGAVTVTGGGLTGSLTAQKFGAVTVTGGDLSGTLTSLTTLAVLKNIAALASLRITGGNFTGDVRLDGALGSLTVLQDAHKNGGSISGAEINAAKIAAITVAKDLTNAQIWAGADLGSDHALGGSADAQDRFAAGSIGAIKIGGAASGALIAAGLQSTDTILKNGDDTLLGGTIASLTITGTASADSYFAATKFTAVPHIGGKAVTPVTDARFKIT